MKKILFLILCLIEMSMAQESLLYKSLIANANVHYQLKNLIKAKLLYADAIKYSTNEEELQRAKKLYEEINSNLE